MSEEEQEPAKASENQLPGGRGEPGGVLQANAESVARGREGATASDAAERSSMMRPKSHPLDPAATPGH